MTRYQASEIFDPDSGQLLHMAIKREEEGQQPLALSRFDVSAEEEFLQLAVIEIPPNHNFRPHIHLERRRVIKNLRAQETWIVLEGFVAVHYYSEGGQFLNTFELGPGDITISFRGGHGYSALSKKATVVEVKNGPYEGQEIDKRFL